MFPIDSEVLIDQYIGDVSDYQSGEYLVIKSLTCPTFAKHISKCEYSTSYSGCYSHGGEAVLTCIRSKNTMCVCVYVKLCMWICAHVCFVCVMCVYEYVCVCDS